MLTARNGGDGIVEATDDPAVNPGEGESGWDAVASVFPEAEKLPENRRKVLIGKIRQTLIHEKEEEAEAENIFRSDDSAGLKKIINSLPYATDEEIVSQVKELMLDQEEAELETAHWAFRHQSAEGQLLVNDQLVPFILARTQAFAYLVICSNPLPEVPEAFSRAFGQPADVFSGKALFVEDKHWSGWAWFTNPDRDAAQEEARLLRELWKGIQKQ